MYLQKPDLRREHRENEQQQVENSATLEKAYPGVKSLMMELAYFSPGRPPVKLAEMKYTVNLANAKSKFRFHCLNENCVGGDFDLTIPLAETIAAQDKILEDESTCTGWKSERSVGAERCQHSLRYKLVVEYALKSPGRIVSGDRPACVYPKSV
jgi:hypothetical protein